MKKNRLIKITSSVLVGASLLSIGSMTINPDTPIVHAASSKSQIKISQSKAVKIFKKKFGNKKIKEIDLKKQSGKYVYKIEGFSNTKEYSITINAKTGKVIKSSSKKDNDGRGQSGLNLKKTISRSAAEKIAKKHVKGTAKEWTLEKDDGLSVWDIKIGSTDVKINALTKKVIEIDRD